MKRHTVAFDDQTYDTLRSYAEARGISFSSVVSEICGSVEPEIRKVLAVILEAQKAPEEFKKRLAGGLADLAEEAAKKAEENESQIDGLLGVAEGRKK